MRCMAEVVGPSDLVVAMSPSIIEAAFITIMIGIGLVGVAVMIKDEMTALYCLCGHSSKGHHLMPYWMIEEPEPCDGPRCSCKRFRPKENPAVPPKGYRK